MINEFAAYQLIIFSLCTGLIVRTFILFFLRKKTIRELIVAILIWGSFALVGLFPRLTDYIADLTGFELGINALLIFSILILFYNVLSQSVKNDKLENSITRLVRGEALRDLKKRYRNNIE